MRDETTKMLQDSKFLLARSQALLKLAKELRYEMKLLQMKRGINR